jgi:uncharacterized membrane protein
MNVFTKTTKGKVIGLILGLATLAAMIATIAFALAGEANHAFPTASMFVSLITLMFSVATSLKRKEAEAKAAARRARLYA